MPRLRIPIILFADDIALLSITSEGLEILLKLTLKYFKDHNLQISKKKTKLFLSSSGEGEITFIGDQADSPIKIEIIPSFKYLGVRFNSRPYKLFSDFNANIVTKCDTFLHSILSLTKTEFDRSFMALHLWNHVALPSLLYGVECIQLTENTIKKIEVTQNQIGKYALQVPPSSANIQVLVDAGCIPVRFVICQKVLQFVDKLKTRPKNNLASDCYVQSVRQNDKFQRYVTSQLNMLTTSPHFPSDIPQVVKLSIREYLKETLPGTPSCFALSLPDTKEIGSPKVWLNDSTESETYAKFRSMNACLGNRYPTQTGFSSSLCLFCQQNNMPALNNEVHLVVECPFFEGTRQATALGRILQTLRTQPLSNSVSIYRFLLDDRRTFNRDVRNGLHLLYSKWKTEIELLLGKE